MLADTQMFFLWILLSIVVYWTLPPQRAIYRQIWLLVASFVFVFANAPYASLQVLWMTLAAIIGAQVVCKYRSAWVLWFFILLSLVPLLWHRTIGLDAELVVTIGLTFATLRAISVVIDSYAGTSKQSSLTNATYMFFLPLYTVGPVDKAAKFSSEALTREFDPKMIFRGFTRSCLGLFKSVFIADQLILDFMVTRFPPETRNFSEFSSLEAFTFILLSFLFTYVNFSAFVDIAVGISRMFGIKVIENFNFPIFAKNLQDFWKRWHISLGNWITNYLYMPIVFLIGKRWAPYLATFLAFSLIGWWHDSSLNYIAWGVLHGAGQCMVQFWTKWLRGKNAKSLTSNIFYIIGSWAVTIFFVAWVQTIANQKSTHEAVAITRAIFAG